MFRHLTLRAKILWIAFIAIALCTAVHTVNTYLEQKRIFLHGIDEKLRTAAYALPLMLPKGYHDNITGPDSITVKEHRRILDLLTAYARKVDVKYVYSYMVKDGVFHEASSSDSEADLARGVTTPFFLPYEPPQAMKDAWATNTIRYAEITDEWGHFRSVAIPMRTAAGTRFIAGADVSISFIQHALNRMVAVSILLGAATFAVVWALSYLVLTRTLSPVARLVSYTKDLASQEFELRPDQREALAATAKGRHDEIGLLAGAFTEMETKLLEYLDNLQRTTAAKERIESELKIAHDIQMSFLRKVFPPFPDRTEFDLHATIDPAKEVGGDLYDFFLLDDDHLFFYIGDVSDKGVPAALFMAVTMTLMKRTAQQERTDPAKILRQVNLDLAEGNENLLFVTLCCFILNTKTGELLYSNAGHNPPVVLRPGADPEWLALPEGMILGVMPEAEYSTRSARLDPGDQIVLYTDGVTEAMNPERELYSDERLQATLARLRSQAPSGLVQGIMDSVREHARGAVQSDDITILALEYKKDGG